MTPIERLTPIFEQGDVVRVPFPYTDGGKRPNRPALVISMGAVGEAKQLLWVAMITSAENRAWVGDVDFGDTLAAAGLPAPSVVRPLKIVTIDADRAEVLGRADTAITRAVMQVIGTRMGFDR